MTPATENVIRKYDAEAKDAQLRAEACSWGNPVIQPAKPDDVPVINVAEWFRTGDPPELQKLAMKLQRANEEVGFYQLVGHGIVQSSTENILQQTRAFHSLPDQVKQDIAMDVPGNPIGGIGYLGYGNWKVPSRSKPNQNAAFIVKKDHRISFDENLWPKEDLLSDFRHSVEEYAVLVTKLAKKLLPIYAVALDLPTDFFERAFQDPFFRLRMSHYQPSIKGDGFGIHPHVDTCFFTLLLTDGTPGLTIYSHNRDEWIALPKPEPNSFFVNSGELLRQWSNDRCLSTRHFVTNTSNKDRYSVPFFFTPNSDYQMECLPSCYGPGNPAKYPPFSYNESQGVVQGE